MITGANLLSGTMLLILMRVVEKKSINYVHIENHLGLASKASIPRKLGQLLIHDLVRIDKYPPDRQYYVSSTAKGRDAMEAYRAIEADYLNAGQIELLQIIMDNPGRRIQYELKRGRCYGWLMVSNGYATRDTNGYDKKPYLYTITTHGRNVLMLNKRYREFFN